MYISMFFFISAVIGGEWSASRPGRFTLARKSLRHPLDRRPGGPPSRSGRCEETILEHTGIRTANPKSSSPKPVAIPTSLFQFLPEGGTVNKFGLSSGL
jgi:hypothetical protein